MANLNKELTYEQVQALLEEYALNDSDFVVDLDDAWRWLGYSEKGKAKRALVNSGFVEGVDYQLAISGKQACGEGLDFSGTNRKTSTGGSGLNKETILLTLDCFKQFCMLAGTDKGKETRLYFIKAEKENKANKALVAKQAELLERAQRAVTTHASMHSALVLKAGVLGAPVDELSMFCVEAASGVSYVSLMNETEYGTAWSPAVMRTQGKVVELERLNLLKGYVASGVFKPSRETWRQFVQRQALKLK